MTKDEIRAELRRSACEDKDPFWGIDVDVWGMAEDIANECRESTFNLSAKNLRTFFLFVAEAM